MGYYSEVALVTSKDAYSRLLAAVAKYPEATKFVIDAIENDNLCEAESKWYSTN